MDYIKRGAKKPGRALSQINLSAAVTVGISDDVEQPIDRRKPSLALQISAMGSADSNFYPEVFQRAGLVEDTKAV